MDRRNRRILSHWLAAALLAIAQVLFVAHVYTSPYAVSHPGCEACLIGGSAVPAVDTTPTIAPQPIRMAPVVELHHGVVAQPVLYSGSPRSPPATLLYS